MKRINALKSASKQEFDLVVIGGGATGSGIALDATLRGLQVLLIEKNDFSSGTSSRSTKLIHGGVRYLAQLNFNLVREALRERTALLKNAPNQVIPLQILLPFYSIWDRIKYSLGLWLYDLLSDKSLPSHYKISAGEALNFFPDLNTQNLKGGIIYYDAQFNDSRLNLALVKNAEQQGAVVLNKASFENFQKTDGKITAVTFKDRITNKPIEAKCRAVVNATGVWLDQVLQQDDPGHKNIISPSQGIHLVFKNKGYQPGHAVLIPETADGRILFMIPWENYLIAGTTDTAVKKVMEEPLPIKGETEFILNTMNQYSSYNWSKKDITSVFSGLRPLIAATGKNTSSLSRESRILVSPAGLISVGGGKWTTYRHMAQTVVDQVVSLHKFKCRPCQSKNFQLSGLKSFQDLEKISEKYKTDQFATNRLFEYYGENVFKILKDRPAEIKGIRGYFREEVQYFIRHEYALEVLDIIARRWRLLFTDLELAEKASKPVADILARELKWNSSRKKASLEECLLLIQKLKHCI